MNCDGAHPQATITSTSYLDKRHFAEIMELETSVYTEPNGPPTREQLCNVLAVALGSARPGERRPLSTYEPLAWLLRDDSGDRKVRRTRRLLYRKLLRDLAAEFDVIYSERLVASNGLWDFSDVYIAAERARRCIWQMRWCAFQHMLHLPGARAQSIEAYRTIMEVLSPAVDASSA